MKSGGAGPSNLRDGTWHSDGRTRGRKRKYNPQDQVDQEASAGAENGQEPEHANQRGIEIEIIGKAGTDTTDFLVPTGAHEALGCDDRERSARAGRIRLFCAAVVAELGTWGDFLLTT